MFIVPTLMFLSCAAEPHVVTGCKDKHLEYMGRVKIDDSAAVIYWSGSSVTMNFIGSTVKVRLRDERGDNYFYSIVDDKTITTIHPDTIAKEYFLATNLSKGKHKIQLFKLTECSQGKTWFYGFDISGKATLLAPPVHRKKIEFYGNSITAGYSVDDSKGDSRAPEYFNNYYTYAAITARHYDAAYYNISKSGIGLMVSWFPIIMPELYDRVYADDSIQRWDFMQFTPNIVVVDLLQNDSWLVNKPDHPQFKARFGTTPPDEKQILKAYKNFISTIRSKYPNAQIVCTLGSMDATKEGSVWPGYVNKAVAALNDKKIYTYYFPYINTKTHPKRKDHEAMARGLIGFIDLKVNSR